MAVGRCEVVEMMRHTHSLAGSEICRRESYPIIKSRFVFTIFVPLCVACIGSVSCGVMLLTS
jgi:hypothetical protein